jgi:predicted nuclease of predicted toxin-antitoxin system
VRFFADHCVPTAVVDDLRQAGHEVLVLRDHLPTASPDEVVLSEAARLGTVLVSLDGDFADIVRYPPGDFDGIIGLQVKNRPSVIPHIVSRLLEFLESRPESDLKGRLILVEPDRIRVR